MRVSAVIFTSIIVALVIVDLTLADGDPPADDNAAEQDVVADNGAGEGDIRKSNENDMPKKKVVATDLDENGQDKVSNLKRNKLSTTCCSRIIVLVWNVVHVGVSMST